LRCRNRRAPEKHVRRVGYSVNRFLDYLRDTGLVDSLPPQKIYQPLLEAYLQWSAPILSSFLLDLFLFSLLKI
jgi:hypothetical protein